MHDGPIDAVRGSVIARRVSVGGSISRFTRRAVPTSNDAAAETWVRSHDLDASGSDATLPMHREQDGLSRRTPALPGAARFGSPAGRFTGCARAGLGHEF